MQGTNHLTIRNKKNRNIPWGDIGRHRQEAHVNHTGGTEKDIREHTDCIHTRADEQTSKGENMGGK